jgi:hypothetical protein
MGVMQRVGRIGLLALTGIMLFWGITHAALSKYQQKQQTIREACKAARENLTPAQQKQLQCSTPEISLKSISAKPGETVEVVISGKFPAGTNFVFESENLEILKESCNANLYRATIKVAPGAGPEQIPVQAYTPVCCKTAYHAQAMAINGNFQWDLKAANGWSIKALSLAPAPGSSAGEMGYMLEFFRGTETTPFTKHRATLSPSHSDPPSYYFSISGQDEMQTSPQMELQTIMQKMANPNLSDAERDKLTKQIEQISTRMQAEVQKMTDPKYLQKMQAQEQEFGCRNINLKVQNGAATGNITCSDKVGRNLSLTGTMKLLTK